MDEMARFVFSGDLHEDYEFTKQMIDYANKSSVNDIIVLGDLIEGKNIGQKINENIDIKVKEKLTSDQIHEFIQFNTLNITLSNIDKPILSDVSSIDELIENIANGNIDSIQLTNAIRDKAKEISNVRQGFSQILEPLLPLNSQKIKKLSENYSYAKPIIENAEKDALQKTLEEYINPVYDQFNSLWTEFNGTVSVGLGNHDTKQIWSMNNAKVYDNKIVDVNGIKAYFSFASAQDTNDKLSQNLPIELALEELVNVDNLKNKFGVNDEYLEGLCDDYNNSPRRADIFKANNPDEIEITQEVIRYVRYGMNNREFDHRVEEYIQANNVDKDAAEYEIIKDDPVYKRLEKQVADGGIELFALHEPTGDHASNHVWNNPEHPKHNNGRGNPWSFYSAGIHYLAKKHKIPVIGGHTHHAVVTNKDGYLVMVSSDDIFYDVDYNPKTKKINRIDVYKKAA